MKLNEYIHDELDRNGINLKLSWREESLTTEDVAVWIIEWYKKTYDRLPPTWLADTTDVRKKIQ